MGGTYINTTFKDRHSENPNRRRLIPVTGSDNLYDVIREEGNVDNPGTPFNAQTMNTFNKNISDMFPVTPGNGGTGETSISNFLDKYNLSTKTDHSNNKIQLKGKVYKDKSATTDKTDAVLTTTYQQCACYKLGKLCIVSILIRAHRAHKTIQDAEGYWIIDPNEEEKKYLEIHYLPYAPAYSEGLASGNAQNIYMPCAIATHKGSRYGSYLYDSDGISVKSTICYLSASEGKIIFQESTGQKRVYIKPETDIDINLSGIYYTKNV